MCVAGVCGQNSVLAASQQNLLVFITDCVLCRLPAEVGVSQLVFA